MQSNDVGGARLALRRFWWICVAVSVLLATLLFVYQTVTNEISYAATARLLSSKGTLTPSEGTDGQTLDLQELANPEVLINTYSNILETQVVLEGILQKLRVTYGDTYSDMTYTELRNKISCGSVNDTVVFYVTVRDSDPVRATQMAEMICREFPEQLKDVYSFRDSPVKVMEYPRSADEAVRTEKRNIGQILFLSFAAGLLTLAAVAVVGKYADIAPTSAAGYRELCPDLPLLAEVEGEDAGGYRLLAANIGVLTGGAKLIGVSSVGRGMSARVVAERLAAAMAGAGRRTLLLSSHVAVSPTSGRLLHVGEGEADIFLADICPETPEGILSLAAYRREERNLLASYDCIIAELPDADFLSQTSASVAEALVLSVAGRRVGRRTYRRVTEELRAVGAPLVGFTYGASPLAASKK